MSKVTTAIFYNSYKQKADGNCPVSLRVTFQRKQKYYPTVFEFTPDEWEKMNGERPRGKLKEYAIRLTTLEKRARDIIDTLQPFTWQQFENRWNERYFLYTVKAGLEQHAIYLRQIDQIGTAVTYECAMGSIERFSPNLKFADLTPDMLNKYETWMLAQGRSVTTISMYVRSIRAVYNRAIKTGVVPANLYPFGRGKYEIPTGRNIKKALAMADIAQIFNYQSDNETTSRMKDYWIFLYLCNGMNVKDFCRLKYKDIHSDTLTYIRAKTARTKREIEPIRVPLLDEAKVIINRCGNPNRSPETYIFPILSKGITAVRERELIQLITHLINEHLRKVAESIGIEKLTTYTARHSFATIMKRSGVSVEFISESLGHTDTKTTQNYLAGFEDEEKRKRAQVLVPKPTPVLKIAKVS